MVAETAAEQQQLLADANQRSAAIEFEHKQRLQERVAQLDNEKAILLAELERQLNDRQEAILLRARENIDGIQNAANAKKMAVLLEAQSQSQQQVGQITEQVAGLAAEDAQRRLQTTTQTVRSLFFFFFSKVVRALPLGDYQQCCGLVGESPDGEPVDPSQLNVLSRSLFSPVFFVNLAFCCSLKSLNRNDLRIKSSPERHGSDSLFSAKCLPEGWLLTICVSVCVCVCVWTSVPKGLGE